MHAILKNIEKTKGYTFPFEGESHLCTVMILPYREDTWREEAKPALEEFFTLVKTISQYEMVVLICDPDLDYRIVSRFELKNVHILRLNTDDCWARDTLPVFMKNQEGNLLGVDFGFNAWGGSFDGLYSPWDKDNTLGKELLLELMIPRHPAKDFILEGGSVHSDGEGTLLTTECCLLSQGRNPNLSKDQIEARLKDELQVQKVLWLPKGIVEDETDGHVDNIACFLAPGVVALAWCEDENDPQYLACKEDYDYLSSQKDALGRDLKIIKIPLPKVQYLTKEEAEGIKASPDAIQRQPGRRLAASYINFYMGKDFILLPQFHDPNDIKAVQILKDFYQGTKAILPVYSREILLGGGNIHCVTKQIPYADGYEIEPKEEEE